jgi:hypothetical protein
LAQEYGVEPETLTYRCDKQTTSDGLPYVIEAACGWSQDEEAAADARLCGYNFSPCLRTPFPALDQWCDDVDIEYRDHVVLMVHLACPRLDATDSGKTAVVLPGEITTAMAAVVQKVTQRWTKMKKTARRTSRREAQEAERERRRHRPMSTKQACDQVMEQAYLKASDQGRGPANARQIMYAARPWVIELTGKDKPWKRSQQFTQGYLIQFIEAHPDLTAQWDVVFDARGHFREPHARRPAQRFDIGTVDVRRYLQDWQCRLVPSIAFNINTDLDTLGPTFRYRYALFVEKEGFDEHFAQARLAERYDLALMSTKGQTTTSARRLVDELSQAGVTILVLHDLDKSGLEILRMFTTSNHRYHYKSEPRVIDLGLRWADVDAMGLEREDVAYRKKFDPRPGLRAAGASAEELAMLASRYDRWGEKWTGQRVELNAMTTPQLLGWLEGKLHALGVEKVVPEGGTLATIWRYYTQLGWLNTELKTVRSRMPPDAAIVVPDDLAQQVRARIQNTALPWEQAVEALVDEARATA